MTSASKSSHGSLICCPVGPASNAVMPDPTPDLGRVSRACAFICAPAVGEAMMMRFAAAGQEAKQGTLGIVLDNPSVSHEFSVRAQARSRAAASMTCVRRPDHLGTGARAWGG